MWFGINLDLNLDLLIELTTMLCPLPTITLLAPAHDILFCKLESLEVICLQTKFGIQGFEAPTYDLDEQGTCLLMHKMQSDSFDYLENWMSYLLKALVFELFLLKA